MYLLLALAAISGLVSCVVIFSIWFPETLVGKKFNPILEGHSTAGILIICFVVFLLSSVAAGFVWQHKTYVSVDAVILSSTEEYIETETEDGIYKSFVTVYEFDYKGETYRDTWNRNEQRTVGTVETLKIDPAYPQATDNPVEKIVITVLALNGGMFLCGVAHDLGWSKNGTEKGNASVDEQKKAKRVRKANLFAKIAAWVFPCAFICVIIGIYLKNETAKAILSALAGIGGFGGLLCFIMWFALHPRNPEYRSGTVIGESPLYYREETSYGGDYRKKPR